MKYIIAPRTAVVGNGITPATNLVIDGMVVINENELKYRFPGQELEALAANLGGIIVSRVGAMDFVKKRKTLSQLKDNEQ